MNLHLWHEVKYKGYNYKLYTYTDRSFNESFWMAKAFNSKGKLIGFQKRINGENNAHSWGKGLINKYMKTH